MNINQSDTGIGDKNLSLELYVIRKKLWFVSEWNITIGKENIKVVSSVQMLDIHKYSKLNFNYLLDPRNSRS